MSPRVILRKTHWKKQRNALGQLRIEQHASDGLMRERKLNLRFSEGRAPRQIVVVVDGSGSMYGPALEEAKQVARISGGLARKTFALRWLAKPPVGVDELTRLVTLSPEQAPA